MPITPNGFVPYTAAEELLQIQDVFTAVLGPSTNTDAGTINGVFTQELANIGIGTENSQTLLYSGVYNPDLSTGVFLDSICAWSSIKRKPAESSQVTCQVAGLSGVVIPANSQILNTNGDVFYNPDPITITAGVGSGVFYSVVEDAIPCDINTLTRIVQQLSGWDTVNNSSGGVVGAPQQTDYSLRNTRKYKLGLNSTGAYTSILSQCAQSTDILNYQLAFNNTDTPITQYGVTVPAWGIYLSVAGGTETEIASILYDKLSAGTTMAGNTDYTYTDPKFPWVTFDATWETPDDTPIQFDINIADSSSYPSDIVTQIQDAMAFAFQYGTSKIPRAIMGLEIATSAYYGVLIDLGVFNIISFTVQTVSGGSPDTTLTLGIDLVATLASSDVNVTLT